MVLCFILRFYFLFFFLLSVVSNFYLNRRSKLWCFQRAFLICPCLIIWISLKELNTFRRCFIEKSRICTISLTFTLFLWLQTYLTYNFISFYISKQSLLQLPTFAFVKQTSRYRYLSTGRIFLFIFTKLVKSILEIHSFLFHQR